MIRSKTKAQLSSRPIGRNPTLNFLDSPLALLFSDPMMKPTLSVLMLLSLMAWPATAKSPHASITVIETFDYPLDSALQTSACGISNIGVVAGYFSSSAGTFGFLRNADSTFTGPISEPDSTYTACRGGR